MEKSPPRAFVCSSSAFFAFRQSSLSRGLLCCLLIALPVFMAITPDAQGQTGATSQAAVAAEPNSAQPVPSSAENKEGKKTDRLEALEELVRQQTAQLDEIRKLLGEQQETIRLLSGKLAGLRQGTEPTEVKAAKQGLELASFSDLPNPSTLAETPAPQVEDRLKKIEERVAQLGSIRFSGDLRLRGESFFGLSNTLESGTNPAVFGNELSSRHRMRMRARLTMRGKIGEEFDWGLRFATGSLTDNISTNLTLTDFFNRKPFALDQAFVTYRPRRAPGLRLEGGKFEPPWTSTELTIDDDLMVEGFNESYTRAFKNSALKELAFIAWQLPFLERNSAFVRNPDGTVNVLQSRRGGRDLALYGGQLRANFQLGAKLSLDLSVADLYFSGTQFISPVQVFGGQLQLPVTITIPATATTPAETVTSQVSIPREFLLAGNANLGLTNASNNATNRDGRLASGFNLVDLIGRLELRHSERFPVALVLNFVTNTQARDVVTAGPDGADLLLENNENKGFWGEIQIGKTRDRGDILFSYAFMRIEKDAVLTPFNWSDITQQSDMRGHRFNFAYAADPRVTLSFTGIVTQRVNGLFGPFVTTPPGSLNRATTRLQFDTVIRF